MPVKQFNTRNEAAKHLENYGWTYACKSLGDWVYKHKDVSHRAVISQLVNRKWHITHWSWIPPEKQKQ